MRKAPTDTQKLMSVVQRNGLDLEKVPSNRKNESICIAAVNNNALALEFVPNRFKTQELCFAAVRLDWRAFLHLPENMYSVDNCVEVFERILKLCNEGTIVEGSYVRKIVGRLSDRINSNVEIIRLERLLRVRYFKAKLYDKSVGKFITKEYICYRNDDEVREFDTFSDFYSALDGNLENANLYDFGFIGINLKDYNIQGAYISSDVLVAQQLYDDSFYSANIRDNNSTSTMMLSVENETIEAVSILHESDIVSTVSLTESNRKIYYISDIHLNHKLLKKFPQHATEDEARCYISLLVKKMLTTVPDCSYLDWRSSEYLLVAGDVSYNFEISSMFYKALAKQWRFTKRIIVVLGNHELWDFKQEGLAQSVTNSVDDIVAQYRALFDELKIGFLHNDMLLMTRASGGNDPIHSTRYTGETVKFISEKEIALIEPEELKNICVKSSLMILGGLGFSGRNSAMNATNGIYRQAIDSLEKDIIQTKRFNDIYKKLGIVLEKEQVVILTHMPKENWSDEVYNKNWIYVNGHTHRNSYHCNDEKTIYSDNQIGYISQNVGLKHFYVSKYYDIFRHYTDGIHTISREQYVDFNRGSGIEMTFNRTGEVYMLKRKNTYCFLYKNPKTGTLYLLNGGMPNKLLYNDVNHYYDKMTYYTDAIKELFSQYHHSLKLISNSVKAIGGEGTVHGCIIDIDFNNHVYVNPVDGTITPYFALSIIDKWVYKNVASLLRARRQDIYKNYKHILENSDDGMKLLNGEMSAVNTEAIQFITETSMYKPSRVMRSLQYLTDANVIRIWNDKVFDIQPRIETRMNQIE